MSWFEEPAKRLKTLFPKSAEAEVEAAILDNHRGPPPLPERVQITSPDQVTVDLYEKYKERMGNPRNIMPVLFADYKYHKDTPKKAYSTVVNPELYKHANWGATPSFRPAETFSTLFCIMLGCDNAHDFTRALVRKIFSEYTAPDDVKAAHVWLQNDTTVVENKDAIFTFIKKANVELVTSACEALNGDLTLLVHCICVINMEFFGYQSMCDEEPRLLLDPVHPLIDEAEFCNDSLMTFFGSDTNAKRVAFAITRILGLTEVTAGFLLGKERPISTLNIYREITKDARTPLKVRIDATSAGVNHAPDVPALQEDPESVVLVEDIVSRMDPATRGVLHGIIKRFVGHPPIPTSHQPISIKVFVRVNGGNLVFSESKLDTESPNVFSHVVRTYLGAPINYKIISGFTKSSLMRDIIKEWMTKYANDPINLTDAKSIKFKEFIRAHTCFKTLGDFLQIIMNANEAEPKVLHTFDEIAGWISSIINKVTILDAGTSLDQRVLRRTMVTTDYLSLRGMTFSRCVREYYGFPVSFGKTGNNISKRIKAMSHLELKNKLKLVGIKITKTIRGKRKYLSRKELENKAKLFNKLQNISKRIKIKIMYKKNGIYKYKTYKRLQKEIKKMKMKNKMKMKMKMKMKNKKNKPRNKKNKQVVKLSSFG